MSSATAPKLLAGRFLLQEVLGQGGMATVWRGYDRHLRVPRAIKVMHPHMAGSKVRQRLAQEAQLMARLAHPNVVTLFELGQDEQDLFLVMELVAGGTVAERTQQGPLPPRMACQVELGLLAALGCAHGQGIVHRDVKPHNILLDLDGTPRVTDFGIARWEDSTLTRTGVVMGTLAYMPPEQKSSARQVDARSDLYAAGATLFAMLTGTDPHDLFAAGLDPRLAQEQLAPLPEPLRPWVLRATSFRPEDRFPSASEMAQELERALQELPADPEGLPLVTGRTRAVAPRLDSELDLGRAPATSVDLRPALATSERTITRTLAGVGLVGSTLLVMPAVVLVVMLCLTLGYVWMQSGSPSEPPLSDETPFWGRWQVVVGKEQLAATLSAQGDVVDGSGRAGRPTLRLSCTKGALEGLLDTGLQDVALSRVDPARQLAAVAVSTGGVPERRTFEKNEQTSGVLRFMADRKLTRMLLSSPEATFTYESADGTVVTATFLPENGDLLRELESLCP